MEKKIFWTNEGNGQLSERQALIPATSVKGTLSHRVAFHYNKAKQAKKEAEENSVTGIAETIMANLEALADIPADTPVDSPLWEARIRSIEVLKWPEYEARKNVYTLKTGEENEAVLALFGKAAEVDKANSKQSGRKGCVLVEDGYITSYQEKIFDHVKIDRFTGGASNSALFQEKTIITTEKIQLNFWVEKKALANKDVKDAWVAALKDVSKGLLPLGGKTTKGHGLFKGTVYENNQPIL